MTVLGVSRNSPGKNEKGTERGGQKQQQEHEIHVQKLKGNPAPRKGKAGKKGWIGCGHDMRDLKSWKGVWTSRSYTATHWRVWGLLHPTCTWLSNSIHSQPIQALGTQTTHHEFFLAPELLPIRISENNWQTKDLNLLENQASKVKIHSWHKKMKETEIIQVREKVLVISIVYCLCLRIYIIDNFKI